MRAGFYTKQVPFVNKGNFERHYAGGCHKLTLELEKEFLLKNQRFFPFILPKQAKQGLKKSSYSQCEKMFLLATIYLDSTYTKMCNLSICNVLKIHFQIMSHFLFRINRLKIDSIL